MIGRSGMSNNVISRRRSPKDGTCRIPNFLLFDLSVNWPTVSLDSPRKFSLSFRSLSRHENSHEKRRHERRGAERGHYS